MDIKREHRAIGFATWIALMAVSLAPHSAWASAGGILFRSGKQGQGDTFTCNAAGCHNGGVAPTVSFEGPTQVAAGAIATFTFRVTSNGVAQTGAGFNVAVSGGALAVVSVIDTQLFSGELTHKAPKPNDGGSASWQFTWQAPPSPGSYDLFGSGNSVNLNGNNLGDRSASTVARIEVVSGQPPTATATAANPTATPTPPPPTAPPTSTATSEPPTATLTPTRRDTPVPTPTRTPFDSATPTPTQTPVPTLSGPQPGDGNCDGALGAADVIAVVARLAAAGAGSCALVDADCSGNMDGADLAVIVRRLFGAGAPPTCAP